MFRHTHNQSLFTKAHAHTHKSNLVQFPRRCHDERVCLELDGRFFSNFCVCWVYRWVRGERAWSSLFIDYPSHVKHFVNWRWPPWKWERSRWMMNCGYECLRWVHEVCVSANRVHVCFHVNKDQSWPLNTETLGFISNIYCSFNRSNTDSEANKTMIIQRRVTARPS